MDVPVCGLAEPCPQLRAALFEPRDAVVHLHEHVLDRAEATRFEQALEDLDLGSFDIELEHTNVTSEAVEERIEVDVSTSTNASGSTFGFAANSDEAVDQAS